MEENEQFEQQLNQTVQDYKSIAINKNADAIGAGFGGLAAVVSIAGEGAIAAEAGALLAAATGVTLAAPIIALGIGYLTYKAVGGVARYAIRELDHKMTQRRNEN